MLLTKLDKIFTLFYTNQDFHIFSIPVVARERTDCLLWIKQFCEKTLRWKILSWLKNVDTSIHIKQKKTLSIWSFFRRSLNDCHMLSKWRKRTVEMRAVNLNSVMYWCISKNSGGNFVWNSSYDLTIVWQCAWCNC